ncbi:probable glutamate receptor [Periplaneta americana]|uniref:probable glutamate receptor n=1 Tax=Periplaneta americana TaxID=6978 RepID=UPI0037E838F6
MQHLQAVASSVAQATFQASCLTLHMATTGHAGEALVMEAVLQLCPLVTFSVGTKPQEATDGTIIVTDNSTDIHTSAEPYSRILLFYMGDAPPTGIDETLAVVLVVKKGNSFQVTEAVSGKLFGEWNSGTGLISKEETPWLKDAVDAQLKRLPDVRVSLFECPPYVTYTRSKSGGVQYDGIEVRIVQEAFRNSSITFIRQDESWYNNFTASSPWQRVTDDVAEDRADVAVCSLWLTVTPPKGLQMSAPWTRQKGTFLVPKPWPLPQAIILYLPLEIWTWAILVVALLVFTLIMYSTAKLLRTGGGSRYLNLHTCLLDAVRVLVLNSPPKFPRPTALRYLITSWSFFCLLITTIYLTGYTSLLASPPFSPPINTVNDLLEQNIYWGDRDNFLLPLLHGASNPKLLEFANRFVLETAESDKEKHILQGRYAVFTKALSTTFVTDTERLSDRARHKLRLMKEPTFTFYVAIGLRQNSPYKLSLDRTITQLQDGGILSHWQNLVIQNLGYHYMSLFFQSDQQENKQTPLSFSSVQGALCILGIGLLLSCFTCLLEVILGHKSLVNRAGKGDALKSRSI